MIIFWGSLRLICFKFCTLPFCHFSFIICMNFNWINRNVWNFSFVIPLKRWFISVQMLLFFVIQIIRCWINETNIIAALWPIVFELIKHQLLARTLLEMLRNIKSFTFLWVIKIIDISICKHINSGIISFHRLILDIREFSLNNLL